MPNITSVTELRAWDGTGTATLMNDLTISSSYTTSVSIASTGTFNGNNKTITITYTSFPGLFSLTGGTIIDLFIVVSSSSSLTTNHGWLAKENSYGTIRGIRVINNQATANADTGGIIGASCGNAGSLTISNCYYEGNLNTNNGGICSFQCSYSSTGTTTITSCYVNATTSGSTIGFICGPSSGRSTANISISKCIARGSTAGSTIGCITGNISYSTITDSYSIVNVGPGASNVGGIVVFPTKCNISNSYFFGSFAVGLTNTYSFIGGNSGTTADMIITDCATSTTSFAGITFTSSGTNLTSYTGSSSQNSAAPFTSWSASTWDKTDLTTGPLKLLCFETIPWSGYTTYSTVPTLINCFLKGTKIRTIKGEFRVETLKIGDVLVTKTGTTTIKKIVSTYRIGTIDTIPHVLKIDSFGENLPYEDLYVTGKHIIFKDSRPFHAKHISLKSMAHIDEDLYYFALETDNYKEDIIYANNLEVETNGNSDEISHTCCRCNKLGVYEEQ